MTWQPSTRRSRPAVALVGAADHREFAESIAALRSTSDVLPRDAVADADLVLLAQSRPNEISATEVMRVRRAAPLAGIVALLGTWCEGETRTGRPHAEVRRVFWYQFPSWWRRQLALLSAGRCPDWARAEESVGTTPSNSLSGLVALETTCWETASALNDALRMYGYRTTFGNTCFSPVTTPIAAIWEGHQLDDSEAPQLERFCRQFEPLGTPVIAVLDFPRVDRCELAYELGAAAVLGKPWENDALVRLIGHVVGRGMGGAASRAA